MKRQRYLSPLAEEIILQAETHFCESAQKLSSTGMESLGSIDYDSDWE